MELLTAIKLEYAKIQSYMVLLCALIQPELKLLTALK